MNFKTKNTEKVKKKNIVLYIYFVHFVHFKHIHRYFLKVTELRNKKNCCCLLIDVDANNEVKKIL